MRVLDYEEHRLCARKHQNLAAQGFDREIFLTSRRQIQGWISSLRRNRQQGGIERSIGQYLWTDPE